MSWRLFIGILLLALVAVGVLFGSHLILGAQSIMAFYQGNQALAQGFDEKAEHAYQTALRGYPDPATVYTQLGRLALRRDQPRRALHYLGQALALNPKHATALAYSGAAEWQLGHFRMALKRYNEAYQANPGHGELRRTVGTQYLILARKTQRAPDYEQASALLEDMVNRHGEDDTLRYLLGEALYAQERYPEATQQYCHLVEKHPDSPEAMYSLAMTVARQHAYPEAHQLMVGAVERFSKAEEPQLQQWAHRVFRYRQLAQIETPHPSQKLPPCVSRLIKQQKIEQPKSSEAASGRN